MTAVTEHAPNLIPALPGDDAGPYLLDFNPLNCGPGGGSDMDVTVFYCGAGGDSIGAERVRGLRVTVAANHWDQAILTHTKNFPNALHKQGDIRDMDLSRLPYTPLKWDSPECPYWSQGRGEAQTFSQQPSLFEDEEPLPAEAAERSRALMWDVIRYLDGILLHHGRPVLAGVVENVTDVCKWIHFRQWVNEFRKRRYRVRLIALNSMHAHARGIPSAPQSRDRFYLAYVHESVGRSPDWDKWLRPLAWCPSCEQEVRALQVWRRPGTEMGRYRQQYDYRCPHVSCRGRLVEPAVLPATAVINWNDLGTRIGDRKRPLSPKTIARIAAGYRKYAEPFLAGGQTWEHRPADGPVPTPATTAQPGLACPPLLVPAGGTWNNDAQPVTDPMRTRTTRDTEGLACPPYLVPLRSGRNRSMPVTDPLATVVADGSGHGLAVPGTAFVMRNNEGGAEMCTPVGEPLRTLTAKGHQSLVDWRLLIPYYGTGVASPPEQPLGTLSTRDRYGLASGELPGFNIEDILFRMLQVPEIHLAMAFPADYVITGRTQSAKIRQLGNAVTPPVSTLIWSALVECIRNESLEPAAGITVPATTNLPAAPPAPGRDSIRVAASVAPAFPEETAGPAGDPSEPDDPGEDSIWENQKRLLRLRRQWDWEDDERQDRDDPAVASCRYCGQPIEEHWDNDGWSGDSWVLSRDPDGPDSSICPESGAGEHEPALPAR
jgi:DNA (cytosine-5)-methyltransferase 1